VGWVKGSVHVRVLGPLEVAGGSGALVVGGPRQRALLAVLLLEGGRAVERDRLIDELWGDEPPTTSVNALQVHVAGLRRALGGGIRTVGSGYALDLDPEQVDAARFEALLGEARRAADPGRRSALLREALALWRGEPFAGVPRTPAVSAAVGRLDELRLAATEEAVEAELAGCRHEELVPELRRLVAANPDRERLTGQLMLALHRSGRSADALGVYGELCAALESRLGVDPSDELVALERAIRRGDPTLAAPAPVSLPVPASRFIGRRREMAETARLLGATRLLTLVGPGGCGKTRLAIELAAGALAGHPDGVHFVDLAPVAPTASVIRSVAAAARLRHRPGEPLAATLTDHLRSRRVLLVLDNCEHVAPAAAALSRELLEACAGLRVLATSRQPLGVAGETVWRVPSLALPGAGSGPEAAAESDAVRLLADRAASVLPGHEMGGDDALLAAAVCRRLDALPLAIELVAGRLPGLTLAEVAARLDRRLALLASAGSQPRSRHQTMSAAIDWSHELLEPEERALFRRLAVFVGSFELAAAEAVVAGPGGEPPNAAREVLPILLRLIDKSMVVAERRAPGPTRYRLLETIRDFAADRLEEAGEAAAVRTGHAAWCLRLAESTRISADTEEAMGAGLDPELGNVRAALDWCLGGGRAPDRALAIAAPLWWYWWVRGIGEEGRAWLLRCLAAVDQAPTPARGLGLRAAAALARNSGDHGEALRLGEECLAVHRALGDPLGEAAALNGLCITAHYRGDHEDALRHATASLARARAAGSRHGEATSLNNLGYVLRAMDRLPEAEDAVREALSGSRETRNRRGEAAALSGLGLIAHRSGDLRGARRAALAALSVYRSLGFAEGQLDVLLTVAMVEVAEGSPARALLLLAVADRERARAGASVLSPDEAAMRDTTLAAASAGLDDQRRAGVLAEAQLTSLDAVVTDLLAGVAVAPEIRPGPAPP
jgi:predicted ATPase/DNA-binding SARP family transcriptional activator